MLTRRDFMQRIGAAISVFFGARAILAAVQPAKQPTKPAKPDAWVNIGRPDAFPIDEATQVSEAKLVAGNLKMSKPDLIVFRNQKGIKVISSRCTHRGCTVAPQKDGSFLCPCHKSRFDSNGHPTHGPAKEALSWFDISFTPDGEVLVNKAAPVTHGQFYPIPK